MKKILLMAIAATVMLSCTVRAEYRENMQKADDAYNAGNVDEAYPYYKQAYREKPDSRLGEFIGEIERLSNMDTGAQDAALASTAGRDTGSMPAANGVPSAASGADEKPIIHQAKVPEDAGVYPASAAVVLADIFLAIASIYTFCDYSAAAVDSLNSSNSFLNDPSAINSSKLAIDRDREHYKNAVAVITAGLAGAAIIYTILDSAWFHAAFPLQASLGAGSGVTVKIAWEGSFK